MKYHSRLTILLLACGILTGCVSETSGPDAACTWHPDATGALDLTDPLQDQHLSRDAEQAEDLAIRYADGHDRPGTHPGSTSTSFHRTIDQCTADLFQKIADHHHVSPDQVGAAVNKHRRTSFDVAVILSFALLYGLFVNGFVRRIWQRFPPNQDRRLGIAAIIVTSPIVSLLGTLLGELWVFEAESHRIGYGHLVGRLERTLWAQHRPSMFAAALIIFWTLSCLRYRSPGTRSDSGLTSLDLG